MIQHLKVFKEKKEIEEYINELYHNRKKINFLEERNKFLSPKIISYFEKNKLKEFLAKRILKASISSRKNGTIDVLKLSTMINFDDFLTCINIIKKEVQNFLSNKEIENITDYDEPTKIVNIKPIK